MKGGLLKKGVVILGVFIVLLAVVWFVVVDWALKMVIESQGSKAVGAKVDVAAVDLSLIPAGIEIVGLKVTNPDSPMENALDVNRIYSDIELMPLISQEVIINNMRMEGIRMNTPRKTSGEMPQYKRPKKAQEESLPPWLTELCAGTETIAFNIPKAKDILAKEQLQSLQLAQDLRTGIQTAKTKWEQKLKKLPSQKEFDAYKARLEKIKKSGGGLAALTRSAKDLQTLQTDLKRDMDNLRNARKGFDAALKSLKQQSADLKSAPMADLKRIKDKYALSPEGVANLSRSVFGPKVCEWWKTGYQWYAKLKPYLNRQGSTDGKPDKPESDKEEGQKKESVPFVLIRQAHIDALLDAGNFTGQAKDITTDSKRVGRPMTFKFLGRKLKQVQSINMNGIVDLLQPENPKHNVKLQVKQFGLKDLDINEAEDLALSIAKAMADLNMDLNLTGPKFDALVNAQLDSVQMAVEQSGASELNKALADALKNVTRFGLKAVVEGTSTDYSTKIESDLDRVFNDAVGTLVRDAGKKLEANLSAAINEKTRSAIGDAQNQLGNLGAIGGELTKRLNLGDQFRKNIKLPF